MTDSRTKALNIAKNNTHKKLAEEVGFCLFDEHKGSIAEVLIHRIESFAVETEQRAHRLYRGREALTIDGFARSELLRTIERHEYIARVLREVADATLPSEPSLQAAE